MAHHYIPVEPELKHVGGNTVGGNRDSYYPRLWAWLVKTLNIKLVLDVGCGEGHALGAFKALGCSVIGIDGAPRNAALARERAGPFVYTHDLTTRAYLWSPADPIDLVWSAEVVGYVDALYVENVLATLAHGRWLAMTHQLPGQAGPMRNDGTPYIVNAQPEEYWRNHLSKYGMVKRDDLTNESKQYGHAYWHSTGTIYERVRP